MHSTVSFIDTYSDISKSSKSIDSTLRRYSSRCESIWKTCLAILLHETSYHNTLAHSHSRVPLESIVCYSHTFESNLGIKQKYTNYLKESCCLAFDKHFSFKCFPENALVSKILPFLAALSVNGLSHWLEILQAFS